jgi:TetR/AcrR family transcriptional regulator, regulator of biofilm formation and stress response
VKPSTENESGQLGDTPITTSSSAPKPRTKRQSPGKIDLQRATERIVAREGLQALTYRSVANEAGVSHGLVRHHFGSLDELLVETMRDVINRNIESGGLGPNFPPGNSFLDQLADAVSKNQDSQAFLSEIIVQARREERIQPLVEEFYRELRRATRDYLVDRGFMADDGLVRLVTATIDGLVFYQMAVNDPDNTRAVVTRLHEILEILKSEAS